MGAFARPPAETQQTFPDDTAIMREERLSGAYRVARRGDTEMSDALAQTRAKQLQRLRDLAGV